MQLQDAFLLLPFLALCAGSGEDESAVPEQQQQDGGTPEALPNPLELRGPSRHSFSSQAVFRRPSSSIAQEFMNEEYENAKHDKYSKSADKEFGNLPASSDHEGYASESGYGHSCSSGYVNASAVALLAFLFLLNLVQDIIQKVTAGNTTKKRRSVGDEEESEAMQFLRDGGLDAMKEGLPDIFIPLMVKLSKANQTECIMHPLCDANAQMAMKYGEVGKVLATLLSNIASHAYSNRDARSFDLAQKAAYHGRNKGVCHMYQSCLQRSPEESNIRDIP